MQMWPSQVEEGFGWGQGGCDGLVTLGETLEEEASRQGLAPVCAGGCLQPLKEPRRRSGLVHLDGQAGSERASQPVKVWSRGEVSLLVFPRCGSFRS